MRNRLTDNERTILRLYHASKQVTFYRFDDSIHNSKAFASLLGQSENLNSGNDSWFKAEKVLDGVSVEATSFIDTQK